MDDCAMVNHQNGEGGGVRSVRVLILGGGFAGVETMGGINDFVRESLRFFPNLDKTDVRMVLVTPDELILPELGLKLGAYAQRELVSRGVEILTKARVSGYTGGIVRLADGRSIPAGTLVWTAGNAGHRLVAALPLPNRGGRVAAAEDESQVAL
jgi:NADH:quinone reductase (non-electrogenic)